MNVLTISPIKAVMEIRIDTDAIKYYIICKKNKIRIKNMENQKKFINYLKVFIAAVLGLVLISLFFNFKISIGENSLFYKFFGAKKLADSAVLNNNGGGQSDSDRLALEVLPQEGVEINAVWGDLGKQLLDTGVIDEKPFRALYEKRGGITEDMEKMLSGSGNGKIKINQDNSSFILNLLWAFGLGNKNDILDKGEIQNPKYGSAGIFASTGGWSLAKGETMSHFSKHPFVKLDSNQQELVDKVSKNIYRPCCDNSTNFPDCNHGMAMLGLLELMASQGASEEDLYKTALIVNSYWFPNVYLTIANYFKEQGVSWDKVNPQTVLSYEYSSLSGYSQLLAKTTPQQGSSGGGGCGV